VVEPETRLAGARALAGNFSLFLSHLLLQSSPGFFLCSSLGYSSGFLSLVCVFGPLEVEQRKRKIKSTAASRYCYNSQFYEFWWITWFSFFFFNNNFILIYIYINILCIIIFCIFIVFNQHWRKFNMLK
jgi:uncharacterized integral membrane protein